MADGDALQGIFNPPVPSRVIFGRGKVAQLQGEVNQLGGKRVLLLSGKTVAEQTDSVRRVAESLGDLCVGVYSGLTQRAPLASAVAATELALANNADTLVGVGGSTIADAARTIAVMMAEEITTVDRLREVARQHDGRIQSSVQESQLPKQVSIPTTLSAGEFSMGGGNVLDTQAEHKIYVRCPNLYAQLIVLDPDMTQGTPDWLWHSTGVKALDHCIERLYCRDHQPATDATTMMGAELLFNYLPKSGESYRDPESRLQCLLGAWLSMMGSPSVGAGLSHALGHVIGVKYNVGHGYTSCVTQPYVMELNRPVSARQQALLARAAGVDIRGLSDEAAAEAAAQAVDELILGLGLPHRLRELEIPREDLPVIAELTLRDGGSRNNPLSVTQPEHLMELLERAW
ncbi:MAG: iron-containing alcohol dehydrogenase [Dehalococcoidia bacterium]